MLIFILYFNKSKLFLFDATFLYLFQILDLRGAIYNYGNPQSINKSERKISKIWKGQVH